MAVYGAWAARRAGVPHLFTMHGGRYYAGRLQRRIALRLAALASDSVVTVSKSLAHHLAQDLWIRPSRIVTIPNGVRAPQPVVHSSLRDELRLGSTDQLVVAVGNLYPVKGHGYLLEALALLAPRYPSLHVAIAGRGDLEERLRDRACALQVSDRFHLLGLRSDIGNVLAGANVFVLPSLSEGVPLALLEAMLAGRPVVASAPAGCRGAGASNGIVYVRRDDGPLSAALHEDATESSGRSPVPGRSRRRAAAASRRPGPRQRCARGVRA